LIQINVCLRARRNLVLMCAVSIRLQILSKGVGLRDVRDVDSVHGFAVPIETVSPEHEMYSALFAETASSAPSISAEPLERHSCPSH